MNNQALPVSGIILLNKPAGLTSFDCIRELKRALKRTDLGHCGTLDRFATGLLPILLGDGLKLVRFFLESYPNLSTYWKSYEGTLLLGRQTVTGDPEGEILHDLAVAETIDAAVISAAMAQFENCEYLQTPPDYSAKKIEGVRASDLARAGKLDQESLKKVAVTITSFKLLSFERTTENQIKVRFSARCSKGTYVRRLVEDLGKALGSHGTLLELCRTAVGDYQLSSAIALDDIVKLGSEQASQVIHPMEVATSFLPRLIALDADLQAMKTGSFAGLHARLANSDLAPNVYCAATADKNIPVALLELKENRQIQFLRAFQLTH